VEALADSLEAQYQPVNDHSDPEVTDMNNEAMRVYECALASERKLTNPSSVLQAVRGLMVGKAPGRNGIPNRVLRHLPKRSRKFLTQFFPPTWIPISLLDTVRKIFEKILLTRVLREITGC
jgi:hypothetical protein